jgi:hypothetical protein
VLGAPDPTLLERAQGEQRLLQEVRRQLPDPRVTALILTEMLALPVSGEPLAVDITSGEGRAREGRLSRYRAAILKGWPSWFDTIALPALNGLPGLVPLAERPGGADSFGMPLDTRWGPGYLRVTYDQFYISLLLSKSPATEVRQSELTPYSAEELERLDQLDRVRYALALDSLRVTPQGAGKPLVSWSFSAPQCSPVRRGAVPHMEEEDMTAAQRSSVQRALAAVCSLSGERIRAVTRYPWNVFDLELGLLGESVFSFRPPPTPDYLQDVGHGYLVRFLIADDLLCLAFSREPCVYRGGPPPTLALSAPDWFSWDADRRFEERRSSGQTGGPGK